MDKKDQKKPDFSENTDNLIEKDLGKILASWEFGEFIEHERGRIWYFLFGLVFLAMIAYSIFSSNPLFAIILVIFIIVYWVIEKQGPKKNKVMLTEDGLIIGNKFIEYKDMENFYIIYYPPEIKNLYFQPKSSLKQRIVIPLENQNPNEIRKILLDYLTEDIEKEEMPASEGVSRILKL